MSDHYVILFCITQGWWWFLTGLFTACDYFHIGQRYKVQPLVKNVVERGLLGKAFLVSALNVVGVSGLLLFSVFNMFGSSAFGPKGPQGRFIIIRDLIVFAAVEEIGFYYSHRLFHSPMFYHLHKIHHEFTAPSALTTAYAHPIEHLVCNLGPLITGPLLMQSPLETWIIWWCLAITSTITSHSGYHFPLLSSPEHHDFHHKYFTSNFGTFGILDWVHGTRTKYTESSEIKRDFILMPWQRYA